MHLLWQTLAINNCMSTLVVHLGSLQSKDHLQEPKLVPFSCPENLHI